MSEPGELSQLGMEVPHAFAVRHKRSHAVLGSAEGCATKKIAKQARALGFPAAAITDRNGLYGSMAFSDACKGEGVQPIIGAMLGVLRPGRPANAAQVHDWITLYAQDARGYDNICALVSMAHLDRPVEEVPHVTLDALEGRTHGK